MSTIDQQFIEYIVKSLVGNPDAVQIERTIDEKGVLLQLSVDPQDLGRVIGKRGAGAQALRTLLRALGTKNDARYNLKIVDTGDGTYSSHPPQQDHNDNTTSEDEATTVVPTDTTEDTSAPAESPEEPTADEPDHSTALNKTRKELEDLDDLDI